jgi:branched-chain amino acid aminotransferase
MAAITFEARPGVTERWAEHASLRDASRDLPSGAYTTFRTYDGRRVLRLDQHRRRLEESAALEGRPGHLDPGLVRGAVAAALGATPPGESRFRLTFAPPRLFVSVEPFVPLPARLYEVGARCLTVPVRRDNPHAKDTRFIPTASAAYASLPPGIEEGLMRDEEGAILEGLSSNFFGVRTGRLFTEEERALAGVTRALVLEVASAVLPVERRAPPLDAAQAECLITPVSRAVLPVVEIDGRAVGEGQPGPFTREIARRFRDLVEREAEAL